MSLDVVCVLRPSSHAGLVKDQLRGRIGLSDTAEVSRPPKSCPFAVTRGVVPCVTHTRSFCEHGQGGNLTFFENIFRDAKKPLAGGAVKQVCLGLTTGA